MSKQIAFDVALRVWDLIGEDGKWGLERLHNLFPPNEVESIKKVIIGDVEDREVWTFNKTWSYTVKSGCWLLAKINEELRGQEVVQEQAVLDLKKQIWKVPTLPKIRTFLWRAASGALAVAECLTAHGMPVDLTCKLCNHGS